MIALKITTGNNMQIISRVTDLQMLVVRCSGRGSYHHELAHECFRKATLQDSKSRLIDFSEVGLEYSGLVIEVGH